MAKKKKTTQKAKAKKAQKKAAKAKPSKKKTAKKAVKKAAKKAAKKAKTKKATKKPTAKKTAAKKKAAKKISTKATAKKKTAKKATAKAKVAKKAPVEKVKKAAVAPKIETKSRKEKPQPVSEPKVSVSAAILDEAEIGAVDDQDVEVILTDAEGRRYCRVKDCDQLAAVDAYCRYHYLLFWKKIQVRKKILTEGKLERYIEELTARYPDKFLDMLRKDLKSEKDFLAAILELEIDESSDEGEFEEEDRSFIDEVRGVTDSGRRTRDEDDY